MPLPLAVNLKIAKHYLTTTNSAKMKIFFGQNGKARLPLVLMLELTHACNLRCRGCGRIREYADRLGERLTRAQVNQVLREANTPVTTISGGEPLLHPESPAIAQDALSLDKIVYFCTNGLLLRKRLPEFSPHRHLFFNVHLDGPPEVHDALTGLQGSAERALESIREALRQGFHVTTNTTIYRSTPMEKIAELFRDLTQMGVRGMMVAPAFAYEVGTEAETLTRQEAHDRFQQLYRLWGDKNLIHTPLYMQFLRGERSVSCMPWGTITYTPSGWKSPCYLLTDTHFSTLEEFMGKTAWDHYGPQHEPRCADCMLHSGFEPAIMNSIRGMEDHWRSLWKLIRWQSGN